jgi:hypothetical protein
MVAKTLISNTIDLASKSKELFILSLESQSPIAKKKHNHESIHHLYERWATKLPWVESIIDETSNGN